MEHTERISMEPRIINADEKKIIGFGGNFAAVTAEDKSGYETVHKLWQNYRARAREIQNKKGHGVGLVEFLQDAQKPHAEQYWYLAGSEVENFDRVPEGMTTRTAPAGRYAVFLHKGTPRKLEHTLQYIYGSWFPKSGEELRDAPTLSCLHENYDANSEDSLTDIYIPLK